MEQFETIIIGGGQAGLSLSYFLTKLNSGHVILEKGDIGQGWADRWDDFCLVTPNWSVRMPGYPYQGDDPDGFMPRNEIVAHLKAYADSFGAPVRSGVEVASCAKTDEGFVVRTSAGDMSSRNLVMANGAFQKPYLPNGAETLPDTLTQLTLGDYKSPGALPDGNILIIGSGQSGVQISEELAMAGRPVTLACGRVGWAQRRYGGKDIVWWAERAGFYDHRLADLPDGARLAGNVLLSGHHGGTQDINFETLQGQGVELVGRFLSCDGQVAQFADDLDASNQFSNDRFNDIRNLFSATAEKIGEAVPEFSGKTKLKGTPRTEIDLTDYGAALFTGGFRPGYDSLLPTRGAYDNQGFPLQTDGKSDVVPGLWFLGTHFLRNRGSSLLLGVGKDAEVVAAALTGKPADQLG
ncbi:NAD(P)-binding domain-containing protein [uncultured Boseongicola sp.]|jgi:putative flavoprotein involved in K+ transport|uniref:NAD(P)-binding domain-containing protein n=1 Tax=uncultured Boseongicola sp. TaxID=1648499 RepID=UPI0026141E55|nr:NAD(P)-binding domain-containing protein [uncultured Boseongicola sp.]